MVACAKMAAARVPSASEKPFKKQLTQSQSRYTFMNAIHKGQIELCDFSRPICHFPHHIELRLIR
jgi:hypothetical protein